MIKKMKNEREKKPTQKYHTRQKLPTNLNSTLQNTQDVFFLHVGKFDKKYDAQSNKNKLKKIKICATKK